jgi:uncharacterized LabA/DUF88 family protein
MRNHIKIILPNHSFEFKNYLHIMIDLMKFVENFYVSNIDKKNIVLDTFNEFMIEYDEKIQEEFKINFKYISSSFVDIVISLDNKELFIKQKKKVCCLPF